MEPSLKVSSVICFDPDDIGKDSFRSFVGEVLEMALKVNSRPDVTADGALPKYSFIFGMPECPEVTTITAP